MISFRIDWFDLLAVQGTLKSLLQHHSLKASKQNEGGLTEGFVEDITFKMSLELQVAFEYTEIGTGVGEGKSVIQ